MAGSQFNIARTAQIVLRRALTAPESAKLGAASTLSDVIIGLLALEPASGLSEADKIARAYDAVFDRYDPDPPNDTAFWQRTIALQNNAMPDLIKTFAQIRDDKYRDNACAHPVSTEELLRVAATATGDLLVFAVGDNHRLYLFRKESNGLWSQSDLSSAIPKPRNGHVQSFDLYQGTDGLVTIAVAVQPRRGSNASTVYVGAGLSPDQSAASWKATIAAMPAASGGPAGIVVSNVSLLIAGLSAPRVTIGGTVAGSMDIYSFDSQANREPWVKTRLPEDSQAIREFQIGILGRLGVWTLYNDGPSTDLTFTAEPDQYSKTINLSYTGLPANLLNFMVADVAPDHTVEVYVGGDGVVIYGDRSDADPDTVAKGVGLRLLSVRRDGDVGEVLYVDVQGAVSLATRSPAGGWTTRALLPALDGQVALAPPTKEGLRRFVLISNAGTLEEVVVALDGSANRSEIIQRAVWEEQPLMASELEKAMADATPVFYLDHAEKYPASPVEFFLKVVGLWDEVAGQWTLPPGSVWDDGSHDMNPKAMVLGPRSPSSNPIRDCDFNLKVPDESLAAVNKGQMDQAPFYVHAKFRPADNITELVFWGFYPYNGPGTLKLDVAGSAGYSSLDPLGVHQGDWEHFTIAVDNDSLKPVQVYLSAHDGGDWFDFDSTEIDKSTGRHILYASRNGHAAYAAAGDNPFHGAEGTAAGATVWSFALVNICSKGAPLEGWKSGRTVLISAPCLGPEAPAEPLWLQFPWRWGRYKAVTPSDMAGVISHVAGPVVNGLPFAGDIEHKIGEAVINANLLGDEGVSDGPQAIKYKDNWFSAE
jgi:hypothetical protein